MPSSPCSRVRGHFKFPLGLAVKIFLLHQPANAAATGDGVLLIQFVLYLPGSTVFPAFFEGDPDLGPQFIIREAMRIGGRFKLS